MSTLVITPPTTASTVRAMMSSTSVTPERAERGARSRVGVMTSGSRPAGDDRLHGDDACAPACSPFEGVHHQEGVVAVVRDEAPSRDAARHRLRGRVQWN